MLSEPNVLTRDLPVGLAQFYYTSMVENDFHFLSNLTHKHREGEMVPAQTLSACCFFFFLNTAFQILQVLDSKATL